MQEAFSATRSDFGGKVDHLHGRVDGLHGKIDGLHAELRTEMYGIRDELSAEIRLGDQATRDFMRGLHEEALARIATIGEGTRKRKR
jgi:hypothetical protein